MTISEIVARLRALVPKGSVADYRRLEYAEDETNPLDERYLRITELMIRHADVLLRDPAPAPKPQLCLTWYFCGHIASSCPESPEMPLEVPARLIRSAEYCPGCQQRAAVPRRPLACHLYSCGHALQNANTKSGDLVELVFMYQLCPACQQRETAPPPYPLADGVNADSHAQPEPTLPRVVWEGTTEDGVYRIISNGVAGFVVQKPTVKQLWVPVEVMSFRGTEIIRGMAAHIAAIQDAAREGRCQIRILLHEMNQALADGAERRNDA